ncbi:MAG: secondary thiamine-phosphate synthase enzyme YjbQ [Hyphomonadaceae bacterium]
MQTIFSISTRGPGLREFTDEVRAFVAGAGREEGLLTLFAQHTSCSLLVQENADPVVRGDLQAFFRRLAPDADDPSMRWVKHRTEGPDDMQAHIRAAVLPTSLSIPIIGGKSALGAWQGVYLFEHRDEPQVRRMVAHLA